MPDVAPVGPDPKGCKRALAGAGASQPRDAVDTRVIAGIRAKVGRIIDSQDVVGGWPDLTE